MPSKYSGTSQEITALNAYIKLMRAAESVMARMSQKNTIGGLTTTQFAVLEALYHGGTLTQGEVCAKVLKSSGNITLVIDNLEKLGLVGRQRSTQDRRVINVTITDAGRALIQEIMPRHVAAIVEEMNALTPQEQTTLGDLCRKLGKRETISMSEEEIQ